MRVIYLSMRGVRNCYPALHPGDHRGPYLRFQHGEEGRGRKLWFLPLATKDFPPNDAVRNQDWSKIDLELVQTASGAYYARKGSPDGKLLVLWDLDPGFRGSASYTIEGSAELLAEGYEAQGDAGRMGGAPCPIVVVSGPCVLRWTRRGRLYGSPAKWRAIYDGKSWIVEPDVAASDAVAEALG